MRYFFQIAFDGSYYNGWQKQENTSDTIQSAVEKSIHRILDENARIVSCGRTDKGVHARNFYFHLDSDCLIDKAYEYKLNRLLPEDIFLKRIHKVPDTAHARFSAKSRSYEFYFHTGKQIFNQKYSTELNSFGDIQEMKNLLISLVGKRDFKNFCKTPEKHSSTICEIYEGTDLIESGQNRLCLKVKANRFLKAMMRILAFRLLEYAHGQITEDRFFSLFDRADNQQVQLMPPQGLFLTEVEYDFIEV